MKRFFLRSETGSLGEKLAMRYLRKRGHKVLAQNYYFDKGKRSGEIDLITIFNGAIHFVEVKTRRQKSQALSYPIEASVTRSKMTKCVKTAEHYLRSTHQETREYHFDVVTVYYDPNGKQAEIGYLQDVYF